MCTGGLFESDARFWQSVHQQSGDAWEAQCAAAAATARAAWEAALVVDDPHMHFARACGQHAAAQVCVRALTILLPFGCRLQGVVRALHLCI